MGCSINGALKTASIRLGIAEYEYRTLTNAGLKHCGKCRCWKPCLDYGTDKSRHDRLSPVCKVCRCVNNSIRPGRFERRQKASGGLAWCRDCMDWIPISLCNNGTCREHARQDERERYAKDEKYRHERQQHAKSRKRGCAPMPYYAIESLTETFGGACAYCNAPAASFDHIIPISKGGKTIPGNMVPCCLACNSSKGNKNVSSWLRDTGRIPSEIFMEWLMFSQPELL